MWAFLVAQMAKNPPAMRDTWIQSLGWEDPWRRAWQPTPVFLLGESPWTEEPGGLHSLGVAKSRTQLRSQPSTGQLRKGEFFITKREHKGVLENNETVLCYDHVITIWPTPFTKIQNQQKCKLKKEVVVHIDNEISVSHKKECIWVSSTEVDEPRACNAQWSKSEREANFMH